MTIILLRHASFPEHLSFSCRFSFLNRCRLAALVALAVAGVLVVPASGQTWNGSIDNLWFTGGNWAPNGVPNSSLANVTITNATNNPVLINGAPAIATLMVGGSSSVNLNNGESLTIDGATIANNGNVVINSSGSFTDLIVNPAAGTLTLSGTGTLTLSNSPDNRVYSTTGTATFVNQSTIQGAGQFGINNAGFGFGLNNSGTINANQSSALQVAPSGTVTNTGTLEASGGGTLSLIASVTNTGGLIQATGASSVVELNGSTITGGTLTTSSGGVIQNSGTATVDGVKISSGSTLTLANASSTTLLNTITNNGTIALNSTGSFTDLHISGSVVLTGNGTLSLSNTSNNRVFASGSDTLTNGVNHIIQGAGQLGINNAGFGFTLDNKGVINANQSAGLQIAPTGTVTNTGTMEATGGGTLSLIASVTNTGGLIQATGAGSVVELNGSTITGGTLTTSGGGVIQNSGTATVDGVKISSGSTLTLANASSTTLLNTITNNGTIALNSTGSFTDLHISGSVVLTGNGTLSLSNSPNNRVFATGSDTLTNDVNHIIQGAGQLGINNAGFAFTLDNKGVINANQTGGTLQVAPTNTVINTGTLEATNSGTLALIGSFTNTGALIQATGANSVVELNGSTITGGTLTTDGIGVIQNSGTATVDGVTISSGSTLTLANAGSTTLLNTITNNGTIALNSTGSFTDLHISGSVLLTGSGSLTLSNSPNNRVFATGSDTLTNDVSHIIQGAGQLGINNAGFAFTLDNKGVINANQTGGTLQVAPTNTVINTGTLEATNGGTLALIGSFTNTGALIQATGANSVVELNGSTITGGTLTTDGIAAIQNSGTAALDGVTISGGTTVTLLNATSTTLENTITNNGTIAQNSTGSFTDVHISGNVILDGSGTWTLSDAPTNRVFGTGADMLTNGANHTIQGAGQLGINNSGFDFTLVNNGTIIANGSNALQIAPGNVTNNGTLQVNPGSTMQVVTNLTNLSGNTLAGGSYVVNSGTMQINSFGTTGGELQVLGDGAATTKLTLNGASASLVDANGNNALALNTVNAHASLVLDGGYQMTTPGGLTNGGSVLVTGTGTMLTVTTYVDTNGLTTIDTGGTLTAFTSYTENGGTTDIKAGGTLTASGVPVTVENGGVMTVDGTLDPSSLDVFATLDGNGGIIDATTVEIHNGGDVTPGDLAGDPGTLTINGNYQQDSNGKFMENINGLGVLNHGELFVNGSVTLNPNDLLDVNLSGGFTPTAGDSFAFLDFTGTLAGPLSDFQIMGVADPNQWSVVDNSNVLYLDFNGSGGSPVPEPRLAILEFALFLGLALAWRLRSNRKQRPL